MDMMKQFSLEGKVALVTGAAYGIGFAIAEAFAAAGAKIAFNCRGEHHMEAAMAASMWCSPRQLKAIFAPAAAKASAIAKPIP